MNNYAYRVYKNGNLANPVVGGTITARNMNDAVNRAMTRCGIVVNSDLMMDGT
jgi:Na+-translocating ferredoxin:NAD+ oxidoreductase RnfG subunit